MQNKGNDQCKEELIPEIVSLVVCKKSLWIPWRLVAL